MSWFDSKKLPLALQMRLNCIDTGSIFKPNQLSCINTGTGREPFSSNFSSAWLFKACINREMINTDEVFLVCNGELLPSQLVGTFCK